MLIPKNEDTGPEKPNALHCTVDAEQHGWDLFNTGVFS